MSGSWAITSWSISAGSNSRSSSGSSSIDSGSRITMPSSLQIISTSAAPLFAEPGLQGHRPRRVDLGAEGREDADPPVADLVAEAFDDDGAIVGHDPGRLGLLVEIRHAGWPRRARRARTSSSNQASGRCSVADLAHEGTPIARPSSSGSTRSVAVPERHLPGLTGRRGDDDPFEGDVFDAPGRRPEQEGLARPTLVDHLLVEFADPGAVGEEHTEQATIGDRARVGDREALRTRPTARRHRRPGPRRFGVAARRTPRDG